MDNKKWTSLFLDSFDWVLSRRNTYHQADGTRGYHESNDDGNSVSNCSTFFRGKYVDISVPTKNAV